MEVSKDIISNITTALKKCKCNVTKETVFVITTTED